MLLEAEVCDGIFESKPVPKNYKHLNREKKRELRADRYQCQEEVSAATVVVLDDVTTTGSTLGAMADALSQAGAERVLQLARAVTQD